LTEPQPCRAAPSHCKSKVCRNSRVSYTPLKFKAEKWARGQTQNHIPHHVLCRYYASIKANTGLCFRTIRPLTMGVEDATAAVMSSDVGGTRIDTTIEAASERTRSNWEKIQEIIWDGKKAPEEKRLIQRLDIFIM
jgi:hypothetical protein